MAMPSGGEPLTEGKEENMAVDTQVRTHNQVMFSFLDSLTISYKFSFHRCQHLQWSKHLKLSHRLINNQDFFLLHFGLQPGHPLHRPSLIRSLLKPLLKVFTKVQLDNLKLSCWLLARISTVSLWPLRE
jgi:hypothetical protein